MILGFELGALSVVVLFFLWRAFCLMMIRVKIRRDCFVEGFEIKAPLTPFTADILLRGADEESKGELLHRQDSITADFPMFSFRWTHVVKGSPHPVVPE